MKKRERKGRLRREGGGTVERKEWVAETYRRYLKDTLKAAEVLHVWKAAEQDLVVGGFVPQGEAHPKLLSLAFVHSDVGVPQAACEGTDTGWE